jgi:phosphoserine phosphatase
MIVVSDMMGTLTTGSPFLGLVDWVKNNRNKLLAYLYLAGIGPSYLLARKGLIDWQKWGQDLMIKSLEYIKDADEEKLQHASEWVVEHDLWRKRREDVIGHLLEHRNQGAKIYIASRLVEPFIKPFAARIGAQAIGTPVEIVRGRVRLKGGLVTNEKKIEQVINRLGVKQGDVAYGDSVADIPLFEYADRPVAVFPEKILRSIACERRWEIIGDRNNYP